MKRANFRMTGEFFLNVSRLVRRYQIQDNLLNLFWEAP